MPAADAAIAWQNIERRALDLHAAGAEGTAGQLQVQAVLDFLLGRAVPGQDARQDTHEHGSKDARPDAHEDTGGGACQDTHEGAGARSGARGGGRGGWAVNPVLIVPWDPGTGRPSGDAELPGFGTLDEQDTMDLLGAAGDNPDTRWCITVTGPDGDAVAHGCAPGRHTLDQITGQPGAAADLAARLGAGLTPIARGACQHAHQEKGYKPSRELQHLVRARSTRCTAYGCGRPAAACDLDHTLAWDDGGITCECNLAPLCRAPPHKASSRLETRTTRTQRPGLDRPVRPHQNHPAKQLPGLSPGRLPATQHGRDTAWPWLCWASIRCPASRLS